MKLKFQKLRERYLKLYPEANNKVVDNQDSLTLQQSGTRWLGLFPITHICRGSEVWATAVGFTKTSSKRKAQRILNIIRDNLPGAGVCGCKKWSDN